MLNFNYGEYIFQQLILTDFIQKKLAYILISFAVSILQLHIVSILCYMTSFNPYVDFVVQIGISVGISLNISFIYKIVEKYHEEFYMLTQYLINNYTFENYRYWKRLIVVSMGVYACIGLLFINITNIVLIVYIIQYLITFLIIEQFEQRRIQDWIKNMKNKPNAKKFDFDVTENCLIQSYIAPTEKIIKLQQKNKKLTNSIIQPLNLKNSTNSIIIS